ncbi:MAG: hypothetical protein IJJ38_07320 [Lachnospiraceae bacterium]|nr:hypothetical protein [Lachnospiraceae bacterium]
MNQKKRRNIPLHLASALMSAGSVLTIIILFQEFRFFSSNRNFFTAEDGIMAFLALLLIFLETNYAAAAWHFTECTAKKMRILAVLMLVLNGAMFLISLYFVFFCSDWYPQGYFGLPDIMLFILPPGIIVKLIALMGAVRIE